MVPRQVLRFCTFAGEHPPDYKHDDGAHDGSDEPGTLAGMIPADRLSQESGDECTRNSEQRRQDKAGRLVRNPRMDPPRHKPGEETDDDRPDDTHKALQLSSGWTRFSRYVARLSEAR